MNTIHHLSDTLIRQIAAGEVISEPASIVKEALENSIDAHATHIEVEIKNGGVSFIKIADDGIGLSKEDLLVATDRYSTSKIMNEEDLENIRTLGFRGEFLASLVSVANIQIISNLTGSNKSHRVIYHKYGKEPVVEIDSRTQGTTLTIEKLFENIPARKKFLPNQRTNVSRIHEIIRQFSLSHPEKRFVYISDTKEIFRNQPGTLINAITMVLGRNISKNLLSINSHSDDKLWSIKGYISNPIETRPNRSHQYIMLNNRVIKNKTIEQAIESGYSNFLRSKRFPIVIINLQTSPEEFDPNVHPEKKEIRLRNKEFVFEFIRNSVYNSLVQIASINNLHNNQYQEFQQSEVNNFILSSSEKLDKIDTGNKFKGQNNNIMIETDDFDSEELNITNFEEDIEINKNNALFINKAIVNFDSSGFEHVIQKEKIKNLKILFQFNKKYIISSPKDNPGDIYLIDQHAVSERIALENLLNNKHFKKIKQKLLEPFVLDLTPIETEVIINSMKSLNKMGYDLELSDKNKLFINSFPKFYGKISSKHNIIYNFRLILDDILNSGPNSLIKSNSNLEIAKSIACRNSIKAGDVLTFDEMQNIISGMNKAEFPWVCCHGRPSIFKLSEKSLNKLFWRE